jgi:predicted acyltransferase (DUF342 family)
MLLLSLALFVVLLALPTLPSIFEIAWPKDDRRLPIAELYVRDARWFGRTFRAKLKPFISASQGSADTHAELHMRTDEDVHWATDLHIPASERLWGIGVGQRITVGHGAGIRDAYALEDLRVEHDVVARTLTSDNTLCIGPSTRILRWIDADGEIDVGAESDVGVSASSGSRVTLRERVRFERVWGSPVASVTATTSFPLGARRVTVVDASTAREKGSVILYGPVRVARGTQLPMHLKVHGSIDIEEGVRVAGNIIARGDVTLASAVSVGGHIFAEGNVRLGPGTRISRTGLAKTVYATGRVLMAGDVEVFGWIVSEDGGETL